MRFMDNYYHHQATANMPHFSGHYRQRGSGFCALAAGIGRFALPLARKFILPAAKKIGRELLVQEAPEFLDVVTTKKPPKQALKNTVKKTVKKQTGAGIRKRRRRTSLRKRTTSIHKPTRKVQTRGKRTVISKTSRPKRSRSGFFSKVVNDR